MFSDHHFIHADLCMSLQGNTVEDIVTSYNLNLREIFEKHAPLKECKLHLCHSQPWLMDKIKDEIRVRHMKECKWKNDSTEYNLNAFYQQRRCVANTSQYVLLKLISL